MGGVLLGCTNYGPVAHSTAATMKGNSSSTPSPAALTMPGRRGWPRSAGQLRGVHVPRAQYPPRPRPSDASSRRCRRRRWRQGDARSSFGDPRQAHALIHALAAGDIDGIAAEPRRSVPRDSETWTEIDALSRGFTRFLDSAETGERGREQAMGRRMTTI